MVEEAVEACQAGYRQLKIKVGRGGRWMLPEDGMRRDCEVVLAVREAVGPDVRIMVDANFGYDGRLDLLETFIRETLPANIFWLEEMVTADVESYRAIRGIQARVGSSALLVCGEVDKEPVSQAFLDLIDEGLIDGYQPDIVSQGYARWLEIQQRLEHTGVRCIPHNFGNGVFGIRASLIFGASSATFVSLEDERCLPHVYGSDGSVFRDGSYIVASTPGLGLEVDDERFHRLHSQHQVTLRVPPNGGYQ
jgi:L-alanine-DL-glutamate epimerase-like enolase superfamily enzyme